MDSPSSRKSSRTSSAVDSDHRPAKCPKKGDKKQVMDEKKRPRGWMYTKMASWLSTSEPSVYALMDHQKEAFQKAGVTPNDDADEVHERIRAPVGDVPEDAISPIGGPTPEEIHKKKKEEMRRRKLSTSRSQSGVAEPIAGSSTSSSGSLIYTRKGSVPSAYPASQFDDWGQEWQ